jgi:hypothetical protein
MYQPFGGVSDVVNLQENDKLQKRAVKIINHAKTSTGFMEHKTIYDHRFFVVRQQFNE